MKKNKAISLNNNTLLSIVLLSLITIFVFSVRLFMLLKSSFPTGMDGFFYALQAKSLVVDGALENPDYELGYYFCGFFSWLFRDVFLGCKIFSALTSSLFCVAIFVLLKNFSNTKISLLGSLLSASSFCTATLSLNYLNNQLGILFFLFYAAYLIYFFRKFNTFDTKKKFLSFVFLFILFVLTSLCHLVAAAYSFVFTALIVLRKQKLKIQLILIITFAVLSILVFFNQLPRFKSVFSFNSILPCFSKEFYSLCPLSFIVELTIYFVITWLITIIYIIRKKSFDLILFLTPVLFFPFWKLDSLDMGYRMLLNGLICSIPYNLYLLQKIFPKINEPLENKIVIITSSILVLLTFFTPKVYKIQQDPPYRYYKNIVTQINLPDDSLLIAHLPLNHVYTYYCNLRDCLNYEPDFFVPEGKTWRLAYGTNADYLRQFFGEIEEDELKKLIVQIDMNYTLIREDLWKRYLNYEEDEIVDSLMNFFNPHDFRPAFIRKPENN